MPIRNAALESRRNTVGMSHMTSKQKVTPQEEMLSGWKDIAKYMGRGTRTVQRYERELGLPVRRLSRNSISAVIATKSDLDSWVRSSATEQESFNRAQRIVWFQKSQ